MPTAVPTAEEIANRLGVEANRLRQFVEFHPGPGVDDVAQVGDVSPAELNAGDRRDIGQWIDDVCEKPEGAVRRRRDGLRERRLVRPPPRRGARAAESRR